MCLIFHFRDLVAKFDAHINVEAVGSVGAIKYLFKYITKGPDKIMVSKEMTGRERPELDEITQHINASWFGDTNSLWRLFEFRLNEMSPAVQMLAIHLPDEQLVYFENQVQDEEELRQIMESRQRTSLTAFFELNRNDPEARQYVYPEILRKYR